MSKIEEALEKASKLRTSFKPDIKNLDVFKKVKPREINNHYLVAINQPNSPIAEEYRRLKSILIKETKADFLNTIMITSSVDGEGKSITAINLAVSLAQEIDHSILLIDTDLRKPLIHKYIGIEPKYGLSEYLTQDIDVPEILIKTGIGNLVLLPAGSKAKNPVELLSSEKMKSLIKELKHRYTDRYIIIDTPPLLPFAEAIAIASYVDGIIFVVKEGHAQKKTIENAINLIKDLNILGVVYNGVNVENLDGYYPHYYYSSYKREEKK
jgi:exopolysaccharide/PEP-CTERM locus tyrosine autokinase